jgi:hypothetical protein
MTATSPLPSLFGRFTAILQQHNHLGKTLRRLRSMCAALEKGELAFPPELAPSVLLVALRTDLGGHFAAEESAEYFGAVVDDAPALASQIAGLKWEHMAMLRSANVLSRVALDHARWPDLAAPTRELVAQLERHERAESSLLSEFFSPPR